MKFYYTVASQPEDRQAKPNLSLGGYKSSSQLPNGVFGAMFQDISMYTVKTNNQNKYIGLVLVNDTGQAAKDVELWFGYPTGCLSKMKFAAVDLATDTDGNLYMERIPHNSSKPLYAEWSEADGEVNRVNIGDIPIDGVIGIWFERELLLDTIKEQQNAIYEVNPNDPYRYNEVELPKEDSIEIGLNWQV